MTIFYLGDGRKRAVGLDDNLVERSESEKRSVLFGVIGVVSNLVDSRLDFGAQEQFGKLDHTVAVGKSDQGRKERGERVSFDHVASCSAAPKSSQRDRTYLETPIWRGNQWKAVRYEMHCEKRIGPDSQI